MSRIGNILLIAAIFGIPILTGGLILASWISSGIYSLLGKDVAPLGNIVGIIASFSIIGLLLYKDYRKDRPG